MPIGADDDDAWSGGGLSQDIARRRLAQMQQQQSQPELSGGDRFKGAVGRGIKGVKAGSAGGGYGMLFGGIAGAAHGAIDPQSANESPSEFDFSRMARAGHPGDTNSDTTVDIFQMPGKKKKTPGLGGEGEQEGEGATGPNGEYGGGDVGDISGG